MGGRGAFSSKVSGGAFSGKVESTDTQSREQNKRTYNKPNTPIKQMSDAQLRSELIKAAKVYYVSGKTGISFGGFDTDKAAEMLGSKKMSRSMMEKEYRSILKRL